ncbi:MAG: ribosome small subunit-dependent GTPase A [Elusimicrobia bacterium]|nr:ribosome small subunit-dependent GTPase A [Elusimicrobiota bacterium]
MRPQDRFDSGSADDDDDVQRAPRPKREAKKPLEGRAIVLGPDEGNATVVELFPNQSAVRLDGQADAVLCGYRMATLASRGPGRERSPVCVGDRVKVEAGVVVHRCERRNSLVRTAPNARNPILHVIVANIELLVVVAAARDPEFSPGIVDRFMGAARAQSIPVALCVNKADLLAPGAARPWNSYASTGVTVLECSARIGDGVQALEALVRGKTVAFCGNSGVGKTSLLRRLLRDDTAGRVGAVNARSGMGRHTTTGAVLIPGPAGSTWIDTPGIMNFTAP